MKSVALPFGDGSVQVQLPDRTQVVKASQPNARIAPAADEAAAVRAALEQPLGMPRIGELVRPSSRLLIAFDDPTVPSYGSIRRLAIEGVLAELAAAGVTDEQAPVVCANALHRKWTHEEVAAGLGEEIVRRFAKRLACHDA